MCYLIPKERRFYENMKNSFSFLAKHISWKYIVLILILIYIILLTVPYLPHKTVSEEYKEKDAAAEYYSDTSGTERIAYITDNNDALLYRLGMIEEAEKSIILSTFDFTHSSAIFFAAISPSPVSITICSMPKALSLLRVSFVSVQVDATSATKIR